MIEMNDVSMADLQKMKNVAVVTSTTGQGDVPTNGEWFWDDLEKADIDLSNMRYSVCALGDSSHAEFCGAGKKIDIRLAELGARKVVSRVECDGDDAGSHQWADEFLNKLAEA
jgi:sulfite reductase (NADPH) flavoprotein alpha-component